MSVSEQNPFRMLPPDGCGRCTGQCGDVIEVCLHLQGEQIDRTTFHCDGCQSTRVAAMGATEMVQGALLQDALRVTAPMVIDHLGCLDVEHEHCAVIAVNALHDAVEDALQRRSGS